MPPFVLSRPSRPLVTSILDCCPPAFGFICIPGDTTYKPQ